MSIMDRSHRLASIILVGLQALVTAGAQVVVPDHVGRWDYSYYTERAPGGYRSEANYGLTTEQLRGFKDRINRVVAVLAANPIVAPPIGFEPTVQGSVWTNAYAYHYDPRFLADKVPQAEIIVRFCPFYRNKKTGAIEKGCIEVSHLDVLVNDLRATAGSFENLAVKHNGPRDDPAMQEPYLIFQEPKILRVIMPGVIVYEQGTVVIADPKVPVWIPLTVGEYYDMALPWHEKQAAIDGHTMVLDWVKRDKAAFTDDELRATAYVGAQTERAMTLVTSRPTDRRWCRLNPAYLRKDLPREAVQLLVLRTMPEVFLMDTYPTYENTDTEHHFRYAKQLNYARLFELLER